MFMHETRERDREWERAGERQEQAAKQQKKTFISFPFLFSEEQKRKRTKWRKNSILAVALKKNNYVSDVAVVAGAIALAVVEYFLMGISSICF